MRVKIYRAAQGVAGLTLVAIGLGVMYWPLAPLAVGVALVADVVWGAVHDPQ